MSYNYYEHRLKEINMLIEMGIETREPTEYKKLVKERDSILELLNKIDTMTL